MLCEFSTLLKSWILVLNMAKVSKKDLDAWSNSVSNTLFPGSYKFRKVSFRAWHQHTHINQSEARASPSTSLAALHRTCSRKMSLKESVFGCEGKEPSVTWTVDAVCFSGAAREFRKCVCLFPSFWWQMFFINKAQFGAGFAHSLILKDGAVPAIKYPSHESEPQMVSETASNFFLFLSNFFTFMPFLFDSRVATGKHWVERGEQDRQRTSRRESNSGHRERTCAVCRRTNHEDIGADTASNFYVLLAIAAQVLVTL